MTQLTRTGPLAVEEFREFPLRAGPCSVRIDIAGIVVEFEGLPEALAGQMTTRYGPYLAPAGRTAPALRVEVLEAPLDYFLPPAFAQQWEIYRVLTSLEGSVFRTLSYRLASWIDRTRGLGQIALGRGDLDPAPRALENFLRAAIAWLAFDRDGFFLHGAGIVRNDRAFLFYGPSGAGKSTLAEISDQGRVISDDLTLVLRRPDGLCAAGGPFRGTYTQGDPVIGLFPIAGFFRLRKDTRTFVRDGDSGCFADLLGNLPYVVEQLPRHPEFIDRVRALVEGTRFHYLNFRKDESFWTAIDADEALGRPTP